MMSFQKISEEDIALGRHFLLRKRAVSIDRIKSPCNARRAFKTGSPFQISPTKRIPISNDPSNFPLSNMTRLIIMILFWPFMMPSLNWIDLGLLIRIIKRSELPQWITTISMTSYHSRSLRNRPLPNTSSLGPACRSASLLPTSPNQSQKQASSLMLRRPTVLP